MQVSGVILCVCIERWKACLILYRCIVSRYGKQCVLSRCLKSWQLAMHDDQVS